MKIYLLYFLKYIKCSSKSLFQNFRKRQTEFNLKQKTNKKKKKERLKKKETKTKTKHFVK